MKTRAKTVLGWHFLADVKAGEEPRLPHGDDRIVRVGETLRVEGEIVPCRHGLHASRRALDALNYAPGSLVCRVRLSGTVVDSDDKHAASERTVLWMADATRTLHEFAVWVARQALLRERKAGREPDKRSWAALDVKERWIRGKATDAELATARAAARDAAWDAAGAAAWDAARDAAWAAARAAARDAAWDAARDAANKQLTSMLDHLRDDAGQGPPMNARDDLEVLVKRRGDRWILQAADGRTRIFRGSEDEAKQEAILYALATGEPMPTVKPGHVTSDEALRIAAVSGFVFALVLAYWVLS